MDKLITRFTPSQAKELHAGKKPLSSADEESGETHWAFSWTNAGQSFGRMLIPEKQTPV